MNDTELRLSAWRDGSVQAERLAAAVLTLAGYEEIDPQAPLGGPDGRKDILCAKGGVKWIGAVYFPLSAVRFSSIKKKFLGDLEGTTKHSARGIAFVTNQAVSPSQRELLKKAAQGVGVEADIFHLERIRAALDAPTGFGTRVQFLRIPMSVDDQMSWFAESSNRLGAALNLNTRELLELKALVSKLGEGQDEVRSTLRLVADKSANLAGTLSALDLISSSNFETAERANPVSARLDVSLILLFHRLTCFDLPARHVGRFRTTNVTIGNPRNPRLEDKPTPAPSEVKALTERLCAEWVAGYQRIRSAENERLPAVAKFHARLNEIHPFSDGNGKVSRAILMQQCLDLYGRANMSLMNKGGDYYAALREADEGNLRSLIAIISPVVIG